MLRSLVVFGVLAAATPAVAAPSEIPNLPISDDVAKVPVGSWAEYSVGDGKTTTTVKWSVVARGADGTTLEVSVPDAPLGGTQKTSAVQRVIVGGAQPKGALQVGATDPVALQPHVKLAKPDAAQKAGDETIEVKAGSFATAHYRQTIQQGTLDYWIADKAAPLGIVKLTLTPNKSAKAIKKKAAGPVSMELVKTGTGATATITKPTIKLDPKSMAALRGKLQVNVKVQPVPVQPAPMKVQPVPVQPAPMKVQPPQVQAPQGTVKP